MTEDAAVPLHCGRCAQEIRPGDTPCPHCGYQDEPDTRVDDLDPGLERLVYELRAIHAEVRGTKLILMWMLIFVPLAVGALWAFTSGGS